MGDHQFGSFTQGIIDLLMNTTLEFVTERLFSPVKHTLVYWDPSPVGFHSRIWRHSSQDNCCWAERVWSHLLRVPHSSSTLCYPLSTYQGHISCTKQSDSRPVRLPWNMAVGTHCMLSPLLTSWSLLMTKSCPSISFAVALLSSWLQHSWQSLLRWWFCSSWDISLALHRSPE